MEESLKFNSQRNRFAETEEKKDDAQYMKYREKLYRKSTTPKLTGYGFFIFLIVVFLAAYILFSQFIFTA